MIVKKELVDEEHFIGEMDNMLTVVETRKRAPIASIKVVTPSYTGTVNAKCMKNPLFDLIIENVLLTKKPNDSNPERGVAAAAVSRAQPRRSLTI